jgi:ABC-type dipeptide/oligopeptide/nickel transport system permease subunit
VKDSPPSLAHPFGTDFIGHDILGQVVQGALPSLGVAILGASGSVLLGFIVGMFAGYYDRLGTVLGGCIESIMAVPTLPLLIIIGIILLVSNWGIAFLLMAVLWAQVARGVRAQVLSIKKLAFVDSGKTSGLSDVQVVFKVIFFEVAPLAIAYFLWQFTLNIVLVTSLQFIGLGSPLAVTWGSILYWGQQYGFAAGDWWWILFPGLVIVLTTGGFGLIGFSLEEIANPRLRTQR